IMPMVFSATALSMPAFEASCPINSSILPRPQPVTHRALLRKKHLGLPKNEIQAIKTCEGPFHLQSPHKCCTNAREDRKTTENCRCKAVGFALRLKKVTNPFDCAAWNGVLEGALTRFNRIARCSMIA